MEFGGWEVIRHGIERRRYCAGVPSAVLALLVDGQAVAKAELGVVLEQ
jgi:hypothetical protein